MNRRSTQFLLITVILAMVVVPVAAIGASSFIDVPEDHTFKADIDWLASVGVTKGCNPPDNTKYCPDAYVTRGQMAAFMHRFSAVVDTETVEPTDPDILARLDSIEAKLKTMTGELAALEAENAAMVALLAGMSREGNTLLLTGMNLQVVNGQGRTGTSNGLGNIVIGYNEDEISSDQNNGPATRTGSHYLIIGQEHSYTTHSGIVAGYFNTSSSERASVLGGSHNTASHEGTIITGGSYNTASGLNTSVSGGSYNTATDVHSSVAGGFNNTASEEHATVSGGTGNVANGDYSSILGGTGTTLNFVFEMYPFCGCSSE